MYKYIRLIPMSLLILLIGITYCCETPLGIDTVAIGILLMLGSILPAKFYIGELTPKVRTYIFSFFVLFSFGMHICYLYIIV
jgi:hypothetical protein